MRRLSQRTADGKRIVLCRHGSLGAERGGYRFGGQCGNRRAAHTALLGDRRCWKSVYYPSAKAQVDGGAVMGFGHALFEETIYQEGQLQNGDPFQYRLPVMQDVPEVFFSSMLEKGDGPGPFG